MSKVPEEHLIEVDWENISNEDKIKILAQQATYANISIKFVHLLAIHGADVRNLLTSLALALILGFLSVDNKNIILALLGMQIFFAVISRALSNNMHHQLEAIRDSYIDFLKRKSKKDN